MPVEFWPAQLNTAQEIAAVKLAVWPEEHTSIAAIGEAIADANHVTHVAVCDGQIAGFVDGFITTTMDGHMRWEVDLLAVHLDWRGQGIGKSLVRASVEAGCDSGATTARAFIQINNRSSQGVFSHWGFYTDETVLGLYISKADISTDVSLPVATHALMVKTFNYRGLWLEGELSRDSFFAGQVIRTQQRLDIVGAVIPLENVQCTQTALDAAYSQVEQYHKWTLNLDEAFDSK